MQRGHHAGRRTSPAVPDQGVPPVPAGAAGAGVARADRPGGAQAGLQEDAGDDVGPARLRHRPQDRRVDEVPRARGRPVRQGRVQPQGLQRHGRRGAVPAERLRQLRLHRRRLLARRLQGRAHLGRARRPQRQRVRGLQQEREPEEPAAHRRLHHGGHRLGDLLGLRHHRHHDRPGQPAQVRGLRRRLGRHAGDRRPGAVLQLPDRLHRAVRVRRARARLRALRLAAELPAVAGQRAPRDQADRARTCARPCGTGRRWPAARA